MSLVVKNNLPAQLALGELNKNVNKVGVLLGKIANGQKINSAKDDAGQFAISEKMREQIRTMLQDNQNVQNGSSMLKVAEGGVNNIVEELRNLKELAINSANDTNTNVDRLTIQKEFDQKKANINDIATTTNYNGKPLLDGTYTIKGVEDKSHRDEKSADIVFVVDTTGSMGTYIKSVASNIRYFIDKLNERDFDWRIGIVRYDEVNDYSGKDTSKDIGVRRIGFSKDDFSVDADEVEGALKHLAATLGNGGDFAESAYEGIIEATKFNFRENAEKYIFILTDAVAHTKEGDGRSEYTTSDVIDALTDKGIKLSSIMNMSNPGTLGTIISATDGTSYDIASNYGESMDGFARSLEIIKQRYNNNPLIIHHGTKANQAIKFYIEDMHTKSLGTGDLLSKEKFLNEDDESRYWALSYDKVKQNEWFDILNKAQNKNLDQIDVKTRFNANVAIRVLDGAIEYALNESTKLGSYLQRLDYTDANVTTMSENIQGAESTIRDADMAKEMTDYTKSNVLVQSAQAMLAQANQNLSQTLSLLQ